MRPENEVRLNKIRRFSSILRVVCVVFVAVAAVGFVAGAVALVVNRGGTIGYSAGGFAIAELTLRGRMILLALIAMSFGVMLKGIFHLRGLLGNYSRGEIFTAESTAQIRQLGVTCLLWGGLNVLWTLAPLAIAAHRPRQVAGNLDAVIIGLMVLVIAWFMEIAVELQEENALTV
jgi:hypothetical protein